MPIHRRLPKRGFVLQGRHPITVTILDPIPASEYAHMSVDQLTEHVRSLIAANLDESHLEEASA